MIKKLFIAIIAILVLSSSLVSYLFLSENGLAIVWKYSRDYIPQELSLENIQGKLIGPIKITNINYETDSRKIYIGQVILKWDLTQLLSSKLYVESLFIQNIDVTELAKNQTVDNKQEFVLPQDITLPIDVKIDQLYIEDVKYQRADTQALILNSLEVAATFDDAGLAVNALQAEGKNFQVNGHMTTVPNKNYSSQGELNWHYNLPEFPVIRGLTRYKGNLAKFDIEQIFRAPYSSDFDIEILDITKTPKVNVKSALKKIKLSEIKKGLPEVTLEGNANIQSDLSNTKISLSLNTDETPYGKWNGVLKGQLAKQNFVISDLIFLLNGTNTEVTAKGNVDISSETPLVAMIINWKQLNWPLIGLPQFQSKYGEVTIDSDLEHYNFLASAKIDANDKLDMVARIKGQGDQQSLLLEQIQIEMLDGVVEGSSMVSFKPEIKAETLLKAKAINPSIIAKDWPGRVDVQLSSKATIIANQPAITIDYLNAQGQLRDYQVSLESAGSYVDKVIDIKRFDLRSEDSQVIASGKIDETFDVNWRINSKNLSALLPKVNGQITGSGLLAGDISAPLIRGSLQSSQLQIEENTIDVMVLEMDVDLSNQRRSMIVATLEKVKFDTFEISEANLVLNGLLDDHSLNIDFDSSQGDIELGFHGKLDSTDYTQAIWDFELAEGRFAYPKLPSWSLQSAVKGTASRKASEIEESCWLSDEAKLCFAASYKDYMTAKFTLNDLRFDYFKGFMSEEINVNGVLQAKGSIETDFVSTPQFIMEVSTSPVEILIEANQSSVEQRKIELKPSTLMVFQDSEKLEAIASLAPQRGGNLNFSARINVDKNDIRERQLIASLAIQLDDIADYRELIPQFEQPQGRMVGDIDISGSLRQPLFDGRLAIENAQAQLPDLGLALSDINIEVSGSDANNLVLNGRMSSGGGTLALEGKAKIGQGLDSAQFTIKGNIFEAYNTPDAQIFASPNLTVDIVGKTIHIDGSVVIPQAKITPKNKSQSGLVVASNDQKIVGLEQEGPPSYTITSKTKVVLGAEVYFKGYGLETNIEGSVLLDNSRGDVTTANGEFVLNDAKYRVYGQQLDVEKGKILFSDSLIDQAGIDLRAIRKPRKDVLVGIEARGNINDPDVELFSEPSMRQAEILSYLTLGIPLQQTSANQSANLNQAALTAGLKKSSKLTDRLGKGLGFDEARFQSIEGGDGEDQEGFFLGKYLSPDLYVSYGLGLFEPINLFRIQYSLSRRWKLVTESSGVSSSGDIMYEIESGK